jgi:acyl dehydratase
MSLNQEFVGRSFAAETPFLVGREHIRQFAGAVGDRNPHYHDLAVARAAGYPDLVAPPTFLAAVIPDQLGLPVDDPDFGLDFSLVVHGDQRFTMLRPMVAGDELIAVTTLLGLRTVATNEVLTAGYTFTTTGGELVATGIGGLVSRGTAPAGERVRRTESPAEEGTGTAPAPRGDWYEPGAGAGTSAVGFDEVEAGAELGERTFAVRRADLVRYAGASGDFNPIHWNDKVAAEVGLPGVIAHGMFTMATAARMVGDWAGDPGAIRDYGVKFSQPVVVPNDDTGAEVTVRGVVEKKLPGNLVVVNLTVRSGGVKVLMAARATVALT